MKNQRISFILTALVLLLSVASLHAEIKPTYAITECTIVPVAGPRIENGTIVIRDGLIHMIGSGTEIKVPADAEVINGKGLFAYPGLIDAHSNFFMKRPPSAAAQQGAARAAGQTQEKELWKKAHVLALDNVEPKRSTLENLHKAGITTVVSVPGREIFAGQSVILSVNGVERDPMILVSPFGLHLNFVTSRGEYPTSLMGTMALMRQSFLDAQHYASHIAVYQKTPNGVKRPEYDPFLSSLGPYVTMKQPVVFNCATLEDVKRAVQLNREYGLRGILSGANEGWRVAGIIKNSRMPLFVSLRFRPPMTSRYARMGEDMRKKAEEEIHPANAAELHKAGIKFALTSNGLTKPSDIIKNVQAAIAAGLPRDEALKAMTIHPADFLGIGDVLGTLETGKMADIIVTAGEIFEKDTHVSHVFVDGVYFKQKEPPKKKAAAAQAAVNLTGAWKGVLSSSMGELEVSINLKQDGGSISGTMTSEMGTWDLNGSLSGSGLTLSIAAEIMGQSLDMDFSGKAEKDSLEGSISVMGQSAELKATRIPDGRIGEGV